MVHLATAVVLTELLGKCKPREGNLFGSVQGRGRLGESEIENVLRKEGFKYVCAVSIMVLVTEYF